jgi:hypothetical protein
VSLRRSVAGGALALLLATGAAAQSAHSGSESFVASGASILLTGGRAASTGYTAEVQLAASVQPDAAGSTSWDARGAASVFPVDLAGDAPLVFGVAEGSGDQGGGEAVQVFGYRFADPGSGTTLVEFAGASGAGTFVVSNTVIDVATPPGTGPLDNPLGAVDVTVLNQLGAGHARDGFLYEPALVADTPAVSGTVLQLSVHSDSLDLVALAYGGTIPGIGVPVAQLDGKLELLVDPVLLPGLFPSPGVLSLQLPVPDDPVLVGVPVDFQAAAISGFGPIRGSFSNVRRIQVRGF